MSTDQSVDTESIDAESIDYRGFSDLPQVDQNARPPAQRRPRFDGDVSELPDRACWALQHLLTRMPVLAIPRDLEIAPLRSAGETPREFKRWWSKYSDLVAYQRAGTLYNRTLDTTHDIEFCRGGR